MAKNIFLIVLSGLLWWGCSSQRSLAEQRIREAESVESWMEKTVADSAALDAARGSLTEAKKLQSKNNYENARLEAEISLLESRLVMTETIRDSVVREDSLLAAALDEDLQRKAFYQQTLEKELQERSEK
ncbi:MAG: hypothetical protein LBR60_09590 [Fibrobacter sp.]|jgi:hypothetical protein|nr:hypothetical protein [Fibrobacter sp.]